jgi:cell wall-associated NlpC family hydrolase
MTTPCPRDATIAAARGYLGVPWRHQGRQPWALDCLGLIVLSLRAAGRTVIDREGYPRDPQHEGLRAELHRQSGAPGEWVHSGIALMQWHGATEPSHVGLLINSGDHWRLIHSYSSPGCVVEHRIDAQWQPLIVEVYDPWRMQ